MKTTIAKNRLTSRHPCRVVFVMAIALTGLFSMGAEAQQRLPLSVYFAPPIELAESKSAAPAETVPAETPLVLAPPIPSLEGEFVYPPVSSPRRLSDEERLMRELDAFKRRHLLGAGTAKADVLIGTGRSEHTEHLRQLWLQFGWQDIQIGDVNALIRARLMAPADEVNADVVAVVDGTEIYTQWVYETLLGQGNLRVELEVMMNARNVFHSKTGDGILGIELRDLQPREAKLTVKSTF